MTATTLQIVDLLLYALIAALYLPVIVNALRHEGEIEAVHISLTLYALCGLALGVTEALWRSKVVVFDQAVFQAVQIFVTPLLALLTVLVVITFLRQGWLPWAVVGGVFGLLILLAGLNVFRLPETLWSNGQVVVQNQDLPSYLSMLGWLVFNLGAIFIALKAYRRSAQPLYRNRLTYFVPFFLLIAANDILIFVNRAVPGNPMRMAAALLLGYIALTHDLPDVREIVRSVLIYVITTLLAVAFYIAGFSASQTAFQAIPTFNPLVVGAIIALLLALIFTPLLSFVRRWVNSWFNLAGFDPGRTLQEYGEAISNILEMQKLASVSIGLIIDNLQITRGFLFLVDQDAGKEDRKTYFLRAVRSPGERPVKAGILTEDSPIVQYLTREQRPLLQYDLDLLPAYKSISRPERDWFKATQSEVYVPIFAKRRWIGLYAFGPKLSGNRYTDQDLVTLSALANQTAVALENARLVENLVHLNSELRKAYHSLDKANQDLERIERTKSDFISIASHELRTPLTVMRGYTEMLLEDPAFDPNYQNVLNSLHRGTMRLHEIMDSMFDIAQIDARTLQLHLQKVDLSVMVQEICKGFKEDLTQRHLSLVIDLPALPILKVDPGILRKVFLHLVTNAIKFTPDHGKITISGQFIPAGTNDKVESSVQITVSDTGVGVAPEIRELIFAKFYQPGDLTKHSTSKSRFQGGGAGLGLALSRGIVEAHGGRIWVESPGYDEVNFPGSKFHMLLPLKLDRDEQPKMGGPIKIKL